MITTGIYWLCNQYAISEYVVIYFVSCICVSVGVVVGIQILFKWRAEVVGRGRDKT